MKKLWFFILLGFCQLTYSQQIVQVEYWFNNDFSSRVLAPISTDLNDETNFPIDFPDNGTNEFYETLYYRFKDNSNNWSPIQSKQFFNSSDTTIYPVFVEYWFDNNFADKTLLPTSAIFNVDSTLNLQEADISWPDEAQIIYYRFKSKYNQWSPILSSHKDLMLNVNDKIMSMEFWFDSDFANKQTTNIVTNQTNEGILLLQQAEANWPTGAEYINYRFKSKAGRWTPIMSSSIDSLPQIEIDGLPTLFLSSTTVDFTEQITIYGYNYTPNQDLILKFFGAGGLYHVTIPCDSNGVFSYQYITPQDALPGGAAVRAFDIITSHNSPLKTFFITGNEPQSLKITHPIENQTFHTGHSVLITWTDKMVLTHNNYEYPVLANSARRFYDYIVEYQSSPTSNWQPISGNAQISGNARINSDVNFQTQTVLTNVTENAKFRVKDNYNNVIIAESPTFNVITSSSMVSLEWDKSYDTNPVAPIGVVADGVSRLYIKVGTSSGDISHATITLSNGYDNSNNYLGKVLPATQIVNFSNEGNNATETSVTSDIVVNNHVWFWYVSPDDFRGTNPSDEAASRRTVVANVFIHKLDGSIEQVELPIIIKRPQVLFAHGLRGDEHTFDGFKLNGIVPFENLQFESTKVRMMPGASFINNAKALLGIGAGASHTFQYLLEQDRLNGFASCQVDYVGHSMGGCVARSCAILPEFYELRKNYGKGYIHKLITLGTPHNGSPIADIVIKGIDMFNTALAISPDLLMIGSMGSLLDFGNRYLNDPNNKMYSIVRPRPSNNQNMAVLLSQWANILGFSGPILNSYDLMPSQAISNLALDGGVYFPQTQLRSHLIVGDLYPGVLPLPVLPSFTEAMSEQLAFLKEFIGTYGWLFDIIEYSTTSVELLEELQEINTSNWDPGVKAILKAVKIIDSYNFVASTWNAYAFLYDSDGVVDIFSQSAGLPLVNANSVSIFDHTAHTAAPNNVTANPDVVSRVVDLLNSNVNSSNFLFIPQNENYSGFVSPNPTHNTIRVSSFLDDLDFSKILIEVDLEKLLIVTPSTDSLEVDTYKTLQVYAADTADLQEVELIFGKEVYATTSLIDGHASFNVQIPNDILGPLNIFARAKYSLENDTTKLILSGKQIHIIPFESQELLGIQPELQVKEMWVGDEYRPLIKGVYPSNVSIVNATSSYSGSVLEFNENEKEFTAVEVGEAQVIYNYNGHSTTVYFIVRENYDFVCDSLDLLLSSSNGENLPTDLFLNNLGVEVSEIIWIKDGIIVQSESTDLNYTPSLSGEYYAILYTSDGCSYTSNILNIGPVGLEGVELKNIKVYPNPSSDVINIEIDGAIIHNVQVFSSTGQRVLSKSGACVSMELDISNLAIGVYVLTVDSSVGIREYRVVKK